jgi:hypothetical protein
LFDSDCDRDRDFDLDRDFGLDGGLVEDMEGEALGP